MHLNYTIVQPGVCAALFFFTQGPQGDIPNFSSALQAWQTVQHTSERLSEQESLILHGPLSVSSNSAGLKKFELKEEEQRRREFALQLKSIK